MKETSLNNKVSYNIKKFRELRGYTQKHMADELGINSTTYGDIERGTTDISLTKLEKIASLLKADVFSIMEFDAHHFYDVHHNQNGIVNHHHTQEEYLLMKENNILLKEQNKILREKLSQANA